MCLFVCLCKSKFQVARVGARFVFHVTLLQISIKILISFIYYLFPYRTSDHSKMNFEEQIVQVAAMFR